MITKPSKEILAKHNSYYQYDTNFAAHARLLQSLWREKRKYPIGKLGNYLEKNFAIESKANYLTDKIRTLVQYEVYRAKVEGKLISEPRIWDNLLSSQPLCFNLFGELHFDKKLSSQFFKMLFPTNVNEVTNIRFEYSPGRGQPKYTGDNSAFDVFVEYNTMNANKGFIGIEVKYAENMKEDRKKAEATFQKHKERYTNLSKESKVIPLSAIDKIKQVPLQQIWRDHLLSIACKKDYSEGIFVFLFPSQNTECQEAVNGYFDLLNSNDEEICGFYPRHLETFIKALKKISKAEWIREIESRYFG